MEELPKLLTKKLTKHPKVINLSTKSFLKHEIEILEKGMKFTPTPSKNNQEMELDTKMFCRKLRLNAFFNGNESENIDIDMQPIAKNKSNFAPSSSNSVVLEKAIESISKLSEICTESSIKNTSHSNFKKKEWNFINNLRNDNTLIIKEADKGSALVIMDADYYKDIMLNILSDQNTYKLENQLTNEKIMKKILKFMSKYSLLKDEEKFMTKFDYKISHIYGTPKIHKSKTIIEEIEKNKSTFLEIHCPDDLTFRPIIAGHSSSTSRISHFIDEILKPLLQKIQSYIKDSFHFLEKLPKNVSEDSNLVTFDVISLYTNICHDLGLKAINFWINKFPEYLPKRITKDLILEAVNIILTNNLIRFNGQNYLQIKGVAMGTKMAPTYANLTLAFLEEEMLYPKIERMFGTEAASHFKETFSRFLDDCFLIWKNSLGSLTDINKCLNEMHEDLSYTMEINCNNRVNFLDLTVIINERNEIETDIYYKETDSHQYLNYHSCHPKHTKNNIPYNLMKRIHTFVTNVERKKFRLIELKNWLLLLDYPEKLLNDAMKKANENQSTKINKKDSNETINYITTYNPNNNNTFPIIRDIFSLLQTNVETKDIFAKNNLRKCTRQPKNLKNMITRAEFNDSKQPPTVSKCNRPKCKTCKCIIEGESFTFENNEKIYINEEMTCTSRNVIYVLSCSKCHKNYVGETSDLLSMRMNVHRQQIRDINLRNLYVSKHIANCSQNDAEPCFTVMPIMKIIKDDQDIRRFKENQVIKKYHPSLNRN